MSVNDVNTTSTSEGVSCMYMYTVCVTSCTYLLRLLVHVCIFNSCCITYAAGNIGREFNLPVWRISG